MKKKVLMLIAVIIMASTTVVRAQEAQSNSSAVSKAMAKNDSLVQNLAKSINALVEFKMMKNGSDTVVKVISESSSSMSVSDRIQIKEATKRAHNRAYGIVSSDLGHGDYYRSYDGSFAGMGFNTTETFVSPIAFNHFNGNMSYVSSGYEWGSLSHKWNDRNWWATKTHIANIAIGFDLFNTNEYEASIKANYVSKFAHDLISIGGNVESGVYSSFKDSIMEPYFSGGVHGSVFCLYGSIGLTYSKYIPYQSLYNSTKSFIPTYQIGVKSPSIKISRSFLVDFSAVYCNYAIYQPKVYIYDVAGNVVEDTSGIIDTDAYKGSVSISDHYGNMFQIGATTWNLKDFQVGISTKVNLRNIGRSF